MTPEERMRAAKAVGAFASAAAAMRLLMKGPDDRIGKKAREIEALARTAAEGLHDVVLLEEIGGVS